MLPRCILCQSFLCVQSVVLKQSDRLSIKSCLLSALKRVGYHHRIMEVSKQARKHAKQSANQLTIHLPQQPPQQSDSQSANSHLNISKKLIVELFRSGTVPVRWDSSCLSRDTDGRVRQMGTNREREMCSLKAKETLKEFTGLTGEYFECHEQRELLM